MGKVSVDSGHLATKLYRKFRKRPLTNLTQSFVSGGNTPSTRTTNNIAPVAGYSTVNLVRYGSAVLHGVFELLLSSNASARAAVADDLIELVTICFKMNRGNVNEVGAMRRRARPAAQF